jgi:two-component system chemotaxis sensor kinase CheA
MAGKENELNQGFLEEAAELLADLETGLLELEGSPGDAEILNKVFRTLHTIKGSGGMFGYDDIAAFAHEVEALFSLAREGKVAVTPDILTLVLNCRDILHAMLFDPEKALGEAARREEAVAALRRAAGPGASPGGGAVSAPPKSPAGPGGPADQGGPETRVSRVYRIRFLPGADLLEPEALVREVEALGECRTISTTPPPDAPADARPSWDLVLTCASGIDPIKDIFLLAGDDSLVDIQALEADPETEGPRLGQILVSRGDVSAEQLAQALEGKPRIGEVLEQEFNVPPQAVASALAEQEALRKAAEQRKTVQTMGTIRVSEDRLDKLVDLVGELVILQARLGRLAQGRVAGDRQLAAAAEDLDQQFQALSGPGKPLAESGLDEGLERLMELSGARSGQDRVLSGVSEELGRLTDDLRYYILEMRMLPFGSISGKFRRLVRDLSAELGKKVELTVLGEDTELDKTVIDKLSDPLVHILRNSIDHGVEPPEERQQRGKNPQGRIVVQAEHSGGDVLVRISDDGRGLDEARIRAKAVEAGVLEEGAVVTREDVLGLIFRPGFSTARTVTGVSGRGVGMDVVKKSIEALQGSVALDSRPGEGTTLTIKIPLTLAIIDGLQVRCAGENYIVPLQIVNECVDFRANGAAGQGSRQIFNHRGEVIPYVSLRSYFRLGGEAPDMSKIVVADVKGRRVGLLVDEVVGQCQTVIKSLGQVYRHVRSISGASIAADGSVVLILDLPYIHQASVRHTGGEHGDSRQN